MSVSTSAGLASALSLVRRGELRKGRAELQRARLEGITSPAAALAAASVLFVTRDYHDALATLELAFSLGAGPVALWRRYQEAVRLGWEQDARVALEQGAAVEPREPRWRAALLALHARRRDHDVALRHGEALVGLDPQAISARIELASIHAAQNDAGGVRRHLAAALALPLSDEGRLEAARLYRAVGAFPEARALLEALAAGPLGAEARALLAELALWSGEPAEAEALARSLGDGAAAAGARILGAVAAARGQRGEARRLFELALRLDPGDSEAHAWLAELLPEDGLHAQAHEQLTAAMMTARGPLFFAQLLRFRINFRAGTSPPTLDIALTDHLLPTLAPLCPDLLPRLRDGELAAWEQAIELCLARMAGNRSETTTAVLDGRLVKLPTALEPRAESRRALERIRVGHRADVLADLEALAGRFPHSGLPDAHRGELLLWLGDVAGARRALERATEIVRSTRWAYIGLTMCDILDGDPARALETSARGVAAMGNTEGPAVFVHRGEALRRLGRLDDAGKDLERSVRVHPSRVGAWINLGLLRLAQGSADGARAAAERAFDAAPGLLSDAARAEGVALFDAPGKLAEEHVPAVLRRSLALLQGNRSSSCVSYLTPEGLLRFGLHGGHIREPLHGDDDRRLAQAEALLRREIRG